MSPSIHIGPLTFSPSVALFFAVLLIGFALIKFLEKPGDKLERSALMTLAFGLLVARLAFVWRYRVLYGEHPWTVLDIRDGGWDLQFGFVAAWLYVANLITKQPALRRPMLVVVGLCSFLWVVGIAALLMRPQPAKYLPPAHLANLDGQAVALSQFKGKPTVVNFWATWCPPCQREMPAMQRIQQSHPEVNFVFLNQGEPQAVVQQFLAAGRLKLDNVLLDSRSTIAQQYDVMAYPTTLFFDANGQLVDQHLGEMSDATIVAMLSKS